MAPTPLHGPPATPLTVSVRGQPTEKKKKIKSNSNGNSKKRPVGRFCFCSSFFSSVAGRRRDLSEAGGGGFAGVSAAWMPRPSPQGRVHGVPREPTAPSQTQAFRDQPSTHEGLRRSREPHFAGDIHMSMTALNTSVPARSRTLTVTGSA